MVYDGSARYVYYAVLAEEGGAERNVLAPDAVDSFLSFVDQRLINLEDGRAG